MGRGQALFIALLVAAALARSLLRGDAAAGDGITRADHPRTYWGILSAASGALAVFLYLAWDASAA